MNKGKKIILGSNIKKITRGSIYLIALFTVILNNVIAFINSNCDLMNTVYGFISIFSVIFLGADLLNTFQNMQKKIDSLTDKIIENEKKQNCKY